MSHHADWFVRGFFLTLFFWAVAFGLAGCAIEIPDEQAFADPVVVSDFPSQGFSFDEGGTTPMIHMPFLSGVQSLCTQGANGLPSHRSVSTKYDVDFDTSNTSKDPLYAPISGIARVHTEDASKNFGYHVNIDLGDGTYVIIAHMSSVQVLDKQMVIAGQHIGYEGCTGYCSGDHVHVGLHVGDAGKMGQYGTSIPVHFMVRDVTSHSSSVAIESTSFVCGIKSLGDSVDGHVYQSLLVYDPTKTTVSHTHADSGCDTESSGTSSVVQPASSNTASLPYGDDDVAIVGSVLYLRDSRWVGPYYFGKDAFVWGTGGCFDGELTAIDRVSSSGGYYRIDFSSRPACSGLLTLISSSGTDAGTPLSSGSNWSWWQNAPFCSQGSPLCDLQPNGHAWEEWLIRIGWDPVGGLIPLGNGYVSNTSFN